MHLPPSPCRTVQAPLSKSNPPSSLSFIPLRHPTPQQHALSRPIRTFFVLIHKGIECAFLCGDVPVLHAEKMVVLKALRAYFCGGDCEDGCLETVARWSNKSGVQRYLVMWEILCDRGVWRHFWRLVLLGKAVFQFKGY